MFCADTFPVDTIFIYFHILNIVEIIWKHFLQFKSTTQDRKTASRNGILTHIVHPHFRSWIDFLWFKRKLNWKQETRKSKMFICIFTLSINVNTMLINRLSLLFKKREVCIDSYISSRLASDSGRTRQKSYTNNNGIFRVYLAFLHSCCSARPLRGRETFLEETDEQTETNIIATNQQKSWVL